MDKISYSITAFWLLASVTFLVNFKNLESSHQVRVNTQEVISKVNEISTCISEAESFQRNYVLIGDQSYLDCFLLSESDMFSKIDEAKKIIDKSQQTKLKFVEDLMKLRLSVWHATLDDYAKSGFEGARKHIVDTHKTSGILKIREAKKALSDVIAEEKKILVVREQKNERDFSNARNCIYIALVVSMIILIVPFLSIIRKP